VFYFGPGHETYPVYHHPIVEQVIANTGRRDRPRRGRFRSCPGW
jgi:trehalose utilization protein